MRPLILVLMLAACAAANEREGAIPLSVALGWTLVELDGIAVSPDHAPSLTLANGRAYGSAGCGTYVGDYTEAAGRLTFANMEVMALGCRGADEQEVMAQEDHYFRALSEPMTIAVNNRNMTLLSPSGRRLVFAKR